MNRMNRLPLACTKTLMNISSWYYLSRSFHSTYQSLPLKAYRKIFTFFVLMIGLGIIAVPTGLFASALSKARDMESKK